MECGAKLIRLKDDIHSDWFNLQAQKRSDGVTAQVPAGLLDSIISRGREAVEELQGCNPTSDLIEPLNNTIQGIEAKKDLAQKRRILGTIYYLLPDKIASSLVISDINKAANLIHQAGYSLLEVEGNYCGCDVIGEPDQINAGTLAYCQGTLYLDKKRGKLLPPGDVVEHKPGAVDRHANVIRFTEAEKGYDIDLKYTESGDSNWRIRREGVKDYAENQGLKCAIADMSMECRGNMNEDALRHLALFISQLKDVDLLHTECIDIAFDFIKEQIEKLDATEDKEAIWETPWTRTSMAAPVEECTYGESEADIEREQERRREERIDRLQKGANIEQSWVDKWSAMSRRAGCTPQAYYHLISAMNSTETMEEYCRRLKEAGNGDWGFCMDEADTANEKTTEAAKELVARCDPAVLIPSLEADFDRLTLRHCLSAIEDVCAKAEAEECLKEISGALAREKAGIKPLKLF